MWKEGKREQEREKYPQNNLKGHPISIVTKYSKVPIIFSAYLSQYVPTTQSLKRKKKKTTCQIQQKQFSLILHTNHRKSIHSQHLRKRTLHKINATIQLENKHTLFSMKILYPVSKGFTFCTGSKVR